jgi:hypothetical protein
VAASIGAVTSKLGIAITKSATYFHPYELARIFLEPRSHHPRPGSVEHRHLADPERGAELRSRRPPGPRVPVRARRRVPPHHPPAVVQLGSRRARAGQGQRGVRRPVADPPC